MNVTSLPRSGPSFDRQSLFGLKSPAYWNRDARVIFILRSLFSAGAGSIHMQGLVSCESLWSDIRLALITDIAPVLIKAWLFRLFYIIEGLVQLVTR